MKLLVILHTEWRWWQEADHVIKTWGNTSSHGVITCVSMLKHTLTLYKCSMSTGFTRIEIPSLTHKCCFWRRQFMGRSVTGLSALYNIHTLYKVHFYIHINSFWNLLVSYRFDMLHSVPYKTNRGVLASKTVSNIMAFLTDTKFVLLHNQM